VEMVEAAEGVKEGVNDGVNDGVKGAEKATGEGVKRIEELLLPHLSISAALPAFSSTPSVPPLPMPPSEHPWGKEPMNTSKQPINGNMGGPPRGKSRGSTSWGARVATAMDDDWRSGLADGCDTEAVRFM